MERENIKNRIRAHLNRMAHSSLLLLLLLLLGLRVCVAERERLALVTLSVGSGFQTMKHLADLNHGAYAAAHSIDYIALNGSKYEYDDSLPKQWWKLTALLNIFQEEEYDWLVWVDSDVVMNCAPLDLFSYIKEAGAGKDFIVGQDIDASFFNTGFFWMRNSEWSMNMLQRLLARGHADPRIRDHDWYEQYGLMYFYQKSPAVRKKIYIIPNRRRHEFNAFTVDNSYRRDGTAVVHIAGCRYRNQDNPARCAQIYRSFYCMCTLQPDDVECS